MKDAMIAAREQIDRCRARGIEIVLHEGDLRTIGELPSSQRMRVLAQFHNELRALLGDDGKAHPWTVRLLRGGARLYEHPRFNWPGPAPQTPSHDVVMMPSGKYRGAPLNALVDDVPYAEWLLEQRWFAEKFPQHRQYLTALTLERGQRERRKPSLQK